VIDKLSARFSNKNAANAKQNLVPSEENKHAKTFACLLCQAQRLNVFVAEKLESNNLQKHMTILSTTKKCAQASPDQPTLRIRQKVRINQGNA